MKGKIGAIFLGFILLITAILLIASTEKIKPGYVGVVYKMNGGVSGEVLSQGWHLVSPTKHVVEYTVGIEQSYLTSDEKGDSPNDESFVASSSEGKAITIELTYTYQYDASRITDVFNNFKGQSGTSVRDSFIKPNIISWTKEVIARYKVTDILGEKRADINADITNYLADKFNSYGILISNVSLIDVSVDEQTEQAINNKIKSQQEYETQVIVNKTNVEKAEAEAKAKLVEAQANADALLIESEAEAEANRKISESLTNNIIRKQYLDKWDGVLPKVSGESNTLIDIGDVAE